MRYLSITMLFICACTTPSGSKSSRAQSGLDSTGYDRTMVQSLRDDPMTLRYVRKDKLDNIIASLSDTGKGDLQNAYDSLEALIAAQRLDHAPMDKILASARKLGEVGLSLNMKDPISEKARLEIGLAAIFVRNFDLAEYYLEPLSSAQDAKLKANALNARGVIAKLENRIPEAVQYWALAQKADPDAEAPALNLGYMALSHADYSGARQNLSKVNHDPLGKAGLIVAERLAGNDKDSSKHCTTLMDHESSYAPVFFNCGLLRWQNMSDAKEARRLIEKALKMKPLPNNWQERGQRVYKEIPIAKK